MSSLADMEIFARVVATGSMSAAARDLGLSPAVVSKRLGRLEERLGTRLLQRTTRQIALTEAGQGYHERVLGILGNIEEAEAFCRSPVSGCARDAENLRSHHFRTYAYRALSGAIHARQFRPHRQYAAFGRDGRYRW